MREIADILLVEDSEVDTWIAMKIFELSKIGKNVICAGDATQALDILKTYRKSFNALPQLILVDMSLPVQDGIELIKKIRSLPEYSKEKTQLVLITEGLDSKSDLPKLQQHEIQQVILKPLNKEKILAAIQEFESNVP